MDGRFLQSAGWEGELDENSCFIKYEEDMVYIGKDPFDRLVEITAFNSALVRTTRDCHGKRSDGRGPVISGITFTLYAYRALEIEGTWPVDPTDESEFGKEVVGTLLEHCTISFCSRVAGYLRGDHFGWHPSTGPGVEERHGHVFVNNLLTADKDFQRPLLFVWQPGFLCERVPGSPLKQIDYNVYVRRPAESDTPLIFWSPVASESCQVQLDSPEDLNALYSSFSSGSSFFNGYTGPLFKSHRLGRYDLLKEFPGSGSGTGLPGEICRL